MYAYVIVGMLCGIGGFILGFIVFGDTGGVATTKDWNEQMGDQRYNPRYRRHPR